MNTKSAPETGQVIETTTRKVVLPADSVPKEKTSPDFWTYLEALKPSDWDHHLLYIYRYRRDSESGNGPMDSLEKCSGYMVMLDNTRVELAGREETEFAIGKKYGGRAFRLILKKGSERVTETRIYVDAPPKAFAQDSEGGPTVTSVDATANVANHAISTIADQERQAINVGVTAMNAAAGVIERMSKAPTTAQPSETDNLFKQLMVAMMQRMLAPAPDPIELLTKLLALQAQLGGGGGGTGDGTGSTNPVVKKILETGLDRVLNPPAAGPVSSASAELVRQLPQVAGYVAQAMSEWRLGVEAQRDTAALVARGGAPGAPGAPARAMPAASTVLPPPAAPAPPANSRPPENPMGVPSLEFIESRIMQIFREPISAEEAADRTYEFLFTLDPMLVDNLKANGEAGLLSLFHSRPHLKPATQNVPRLQEFIRAFLKFASEDEPPADAGAAPPKPN